MQKFEEVGAKSSTPAPGLPAQHLPSFPSVQGFAVHAWVELIEGRSELGNHRILLGTGRLYVSKYHHTIHFERDVKNKKKAFEYNRTLADPPAHLLPPPTLSHR